MAEAGKLLLHISALVIAEVSKGHACKDFFAHKYVKTLPVDIAHASYAQEIQRLSRYQIKPPDALHIATAAICDVE